MRLLPDQDQTAYARTVRGILADASPPQVARAWAAGDHAPGRALWRSLAATGLPALAVPEEHGGIGWYPVELAAAFVEIGHAGAPGPLAETVAVAAALPDTPAWSEELLTGGRLATVTDPAGPGYAVDAHAADAAYVLTHEAGAAPVRGDGAPGPGGGSPAAGARPSALFAAASCGAPLPSVDPARRLIRCAPGEAVPGDTGRLRALATLLTAAQLLGAGQALLAGSVEYAGARHQFGRAIGSFQAVKHQLADVAVALEFAVPLLRGAALAVRGDAAADPRDLPAAKAACARAAHRAARTALQVHGAVGYTDEYDLTLLLRKAHALRTAWGTEAACRAAVLADRLLPD
ncbi:acyl-CoA/acyl-ACP dehydrogenase [Streptomyces tubbatahanensis]|uniref:Acyl-CoA/acyl-ACP dehydrogenase n=1 Tax=Streptomyces tubbatahanensis TaxID=2923272 RepID=A0ABY3XWN7_9ACTN|nr:acyl-CoA dehydrogenase family protein [Streptomyces tubbatahanensis]UNS98923.1 acyl-CoA/acyl-ACP dehydrogenase [Streptomyces tubbatahanensis]